MTAILHCDQWRDAMENVTQSARHVRVTPVRLLIKKYPDLAEEVFNMCTKTNGLEVRDWRGGVARLECWKQSACVLNQAIGIELYFVFIF